MQLTMPPVAKEARCAPSRKASRATVKVTIGKAKNGVSSADNGLMIEDRDGLYRGNVAEVLGDPTMCHAPHPL